MAKGVKYEKYAVYILIAAVVASIYLMNKRSEGFQAMGNSTGQTGSTALPTPMPTPAPMPMPMPMPMPPSPGASTPGVSSTNSAAVNQLKAKLNELNSIVGSMK